MVHFPLTLLLASTVLDFIARRNGREATARAAVVALGAGLLAAMIVAVAGVVAYFTVPPHSEAAHTRIFLHAFFALSAAVFYGVVFLMRFKRRGLPPHNSSLVLSMLGAGLLFAAGAVGGHLVYHDGVGITPNEESPLERE